MERTSLKKLVKRALEPVRPRLRPSFVVIGAQKAGTSALFSMLAQHRHVLAPTVKELHFFDDDAVYATGHASYWDRFPLVPLRERNKVTFEATPCYLFFDQVPARMQAAMPDAKFIVVLRDPVKRAYSAWNMRRQFKDHPRHAHRYEERSFTQAIEDEMRDGPLSAPLNDYLARGDYATQLERWFALYPRDRFLLLNYRDLKANARTTADRVCGFVGLAPMQGDEPALTGRYNERTYTEPMDDGSKERLYRYFVPHQKRLNALLGEHMDLVEDRTMTALYQ